MKAGTKVLVTHKPLGMTEDTGWSQGMSYCIGRTMIVREVFDAHTWVSLEIPGKFRGMFPRQALKVLDSPEIHTNDIVRVVKKDDGWSGGGYWWAPSMNKWVGKTRKVISYDTEARVARLQDPTGAGICLWYPEHVLEKIEDDLGERPKMFMPGEFVECTDPKVDLVYGKTCKVLEYSEKGRGTACLLEIPGDVNRWVSTKALKKVELRDDPAPFKKGDRVKIIDSSLGAGREFEGRSGTVLEYSFEDNLEIEIDDYHGLFPTRWYKPKDLELLKEVADLENALHEPIPYSIVAPPLDFARKYGSSPKVLEEKLRRKKEKLRKEGQKFTYQGARFRLIDGTEIETPAPDDPRADKTERSSSIFRHEAWPPRHVTQIVNNCIVTDDTRSTIRYCMDSDAQVCWLHDMGRILESHKAQVLEEWLWTATVHHKPVIKDERLELLKKLW